MKLRIHPGMLRLLLLVGAPAVVVVGGLFIWQMGGG